jgi:hypothetical protein
VSVNFELDIILNNYNYYSDKQELPKYDGAIAPVESILGDEKNNAEIMTGTCTCFIIKYIKSKRLPVL